MARLFDVVRELSGQSAAISIPRPYIKFCEGNHTHAAVLSQLVFWSSTKPDGEWFYKANDELANELCLSVDQVRYAVRQLKTRLDGVIQSRVRKANGVPTTHYQIDGNKLVELLFPKVEQDSQIDMGKLPERESEQNPQMDSVNLPNGNGSITNSTCENSHIQGSGDITDSINRSKPDTNKQILNVPSQLETEKPTDPVLFEIPLKGKGTIHQITQSELFELRELYPAVDVAQQFRNMIGWCKANPTRQKTKQGIDRFINSWLSKEQDKGRLVQPQQSSVQQAPDEVAKLKREVYLLESSLNSENQRMLYLIDNKRPQQEVDISKKSIAQLSAQRREILDRIANLEAA
ncbi:ATPase [Vibrio diazotrophicus]|uniref:ATPase n=1 Tax=Vibrio diazotrophicus TaxID=685 RepID=A0ABX4W6Z2_VIBDI|nr:ATPase [Vibrio diazotrophicus]PNH99257.1 ATPase [Vibrio diazotrophicus]